MKKIEDMNKRELKKNHATTMKRLIESERKRDRAKAELIRLSRLTSKINSEWVSHKQLYRFYLERAVKMQSRMEGKK